MDVISYPFPALDTKTLTWWIGLNDIKREHHFVWDGTNRTFVNGTDAGNFLTAQGIHWEPNDQDNEDCVEIRWEQRHYYEQVHAPFELQWNDNSCSHQARFICEKDAWTSTLYSYTNLYDVIKWKHFPRSCPFVRENHQSVVSSHKGIASRILMCLCCQSEPTV